MHMIQKLYDTKQTAKIFKNIDIDDYKFGDTVNELIGTYIHELVHIQQHKNQPIDKPTAYTSYGTKNKDKFKKSIDNINSGQYSNEDLKLYKASPQEIPAFAHNAAISIIHDAMIDGNTSDKEDLKYYISVLDDYIKGGKFAKEYYTNTMPYYVQTFNNKNSKDFKVFKRFMKIVAQELIQYRNHLQKKLL